MDRIDEAICKEDLGKTFAHLIPYDQTRGAEYFGHYPDDPAVRRKAAAAFDGEDTAFEVVP